MDARRIFADSGGIDQHTLELSPIHQPSQHDVILGQAAYDQPLYALRLKITHHLIHAHLRDHREEYRDDIHPLFLCPVDRPDNVLHRDLVNRLRMPVHIEDQRDPPCFLGRQRRGDRVGHKAKLGDRRIDFFLCLFPHVRVVVEHL